MKPRMTVLTIGVEDLDRAVRFYRDGLGWATEGIVGQEFEHGAVAFFDLQAGLKLGYFQDLDGHLWEVVFNPEWVFEA